MTAVVERPRSLRGPAIKFAVLLLLIVGGFLAARYTPLSRYLTVDWIRGSLDAVRGLWWAPAALVGTIIVLGSLGLPATPFIIAGAAIFGPVWGTVWNFVGIFLCSLTGFLLARLLGREFVERVGGAKIQRAEKLLHRRGFLPIIAIRFLPVPFTLVNAAAAVVGVKLPKFLLASAIGLLPPIAILTYFSSALLDAATGDRAKIVRHLFIVSSSAALLVFLPIGIRRRLRRRRAKRLLAERAQRPCNRNSQPTPPEKKLASMGKVVAIAAIILATVISIMIGAGGGCRTTSSSEPRVESPDAEQARRFINSLPKACSATNNGEHPTVVTYTCPGGVSGRLEINNGVVTNIN